MKCWKRISCVALVACGLTAVAGAGEPLSLGALFGPRADEVMLRAVPAAIDMAQKACQATAKVCKLDPVKVADLPAPVRDELQAVFPSEVLERAVVYFGVPLNDPSMGIGFINTVGMIAAGGGTVKGMTFGDEVYLAAERDTVTGSPVWRRILAHELVHVAQYQALGYAAYKEMYAKETVHKGSYEENALESDAFLFERSFPEHIERSFFAFHHRADAIAHVRTTHGLVALADLPAIDTVSVEITAASEALPRKVTVALGASEAGVAPQVLDPQGGEPLHVFEPAGPARLLANARATDAGPWLVALATDTGVEVAWRGQDGFHTQRFSAAARLEDIDRDGTLELVEPRASGARSIWRWTPDGFRRN